jgi:hypothetical protein
VGEPAYKTFFFERCSFDYETWTAVFEYSFDGERHFAEKVIFQPSGKIVQQDVLQRALELAFFVAGTSYYKCFPTKHVEYRDKQFTPKQAMFLNQVFRDGLSQFMFENHLDPNSSPHFEGLSDDYEPTNFDGSGVLALQSGGKDSLLLGELLNEQQVPYATWHMTTTNTYPKVIARLNEHEPRLARRILDKGALDLAAREGGLNGHVPVTLIALSYALIDAVLHGENTVLVSIGREGSEPHEMIGDFAVNHQWSKIWEAEQLLADYIATTVSPNIYVGSPIRSFSELRIAEMFVEKCWALYANSFSSCNLANYKQGKINNELAWCGVCPKCANSFLLFSPFVELDELRRLFGGVDLFSSENPDLQNAFKGILGIDGVMKPFECVGEIDELRAAYHMAQARFGDQVSKLPFTVPRGQFDYQVLGPQQLWTKQYIPVRYLERV